ncbi:MAG: metallophosphoesterase family protein [Thermodesulfobacteriota bacterium]
MRLAVISDIHGNLEAFKQVVADIASVRADEVICLGDNVGYGPEPEAVIGLVRELGIPSVLGNHELGLNEPDYLDWFNFLARKALLLTRDCLSAEALAYCRQLPGHLVVRDCLCVHGCPPDSPLVYIFEPSHAQLARLFQEMEQHLCFVGHTHTLEVIRYDGRSIERATLDQRLISLAGEGKYIVNVGSVGQPRDDLGREAKYVVWDDASRTLELRFVPYDVSVTANKILSLGWPKYLAARLW